MRVVIQRVLKASVFVSGNTIAEIQKGLLVLLGVEEADNEEDANWLSKKIVQLRIFNDDKGLMNLSLEEVKGEIIIVSQFTLHAMTKKGNRPSYIRAAKSAMAEKLYKYFINQIEKDFGKGVQSGEFGADMKIELINDGPVTIIIDTKNKE
jgi:D-tyrosyl-tRNA(Tyr) deacylase